MMNIITFYVCVFFIMFWIMVMKDPENPPFGRLVATCLVWPILFIIFAIKNCSKAIKDAIGDKP